MTTVLDERTLDHTTSSQPPAASQQLAAGDSLATNSSTPSTSATHSLSVSQQDVNSEPPCAPSVEAEPMDVSTAPGPSVIQDSSGSSQTTNPSSGGDAESAASAENRELLTAIATISAKEVSVIRTTGSVDRSSLMGERGGLDLSQQGSLSAEALPSTSSGGQDEPATLEVASLDSQGAVDTLPIPLVSQQSEESVNLQQQDREVEGDRSDPRLGSARSSADKEAAGQSGEGRTTAGSTKNALRK